MVEYFVCEKDCTGGPGNQRWYPGDKMPVSYAKDGVCPPHFIDPDGYEAKKKTEAETKHHEEVKNRLDAIRTDDSVVKGMTQEILNKSLGTKKIKIPEKSAAENWREGQKGTPVPPVAGPQPGSLTDTKRGPGRPPKNALDKIIED
jgi:hypothetical protein